MMDPQAVREIVLGSFPGAQVEVEDFTGGGDHFSILVVSPLFEGKSLIDQHRMVQAAVQTAMDDGRIHAIQIKTRIQAAPKGVPGTGDFNIIH